MMKRLRIYLISAILLVGLIPQPDRLFGEEYDGCHQYSAALINVTLGEYTTCYWGPWPGTIIISIPGFLDGGDIDSFGKQILPNGVIIFAPTDNPNTTSWWVWGVVRQPYIWRDRHAINNLHFRLLPETHFYWVNDYGPLPGSEGVD